MFTTYNCRFNPYSLQKKNVKFICLHSASKLFLVSKQFENYRVKVSENVNFADLFNKVEEICEIVLI